MITILKDEEFRTALLNAIQGACKEILITAYKMDYRQLSSTRHVNAIAGELGDATKRGVRVCCIFNMDSEKSLLGRINAWSIKLLKEKGVQVKVGPPGRTFHSKLIIIDGSFAFVGSHNLSESSLCRNFEITLMVDNEKGDPASVHTEYETVERLRYNFLKEWRSL